MGLYGTGCKVLEQCRGMKGNTRGTCERCKVPGERRGMQGNAKLTWEWVQCARGMQGNDGKYQGNAKGTYGIWVQSARGMEGNPIRMYGSGCKLPGKCR